MMRGDVEISVIILTYNQSDTIGRAIESILAQRIDSSYEIVVSDDCSTDTTRKVVETFQVQHPEIVRLLPVSHRRGLVENYFYALSQCRGRYIADCAGDDYWLGTDSLQRKLDVMRADPLVSMVFSDWAIFSEGSPKLEQSESFTVNDSYEADGRKLMKAMLRTIDRPLIHLSTALYRKSIVDDAIRTRREIVDNPEFGSEDLPVIMALLASGRAAKIGGLTLAYQQSVDSVSSPSDVAKRAVYYYRSAYMVATLADYYGVSRKDVMNALRNKIEYAFVWAYESRRMDLCRRIEKLRRELRIGVGLKYSLRRLLSHIFCS